jgi:nucleotide-binding universal stress UspA family protein
MTKHILVATDGSDTAMRAVELAGEMAAKFEVPLTVAHAIHFGRPPEELARMAEVEHLVETAKSREPVDFPAVPETMTGLFRDTRPGEDSMRLVTMIGDELMSRAADRARDLGAKTVDTRSQVDDPAEAILSIAEDVDADMIVLGHRGLGRLKRVVVGSVAQKVLNQADCTVVSVR